MTLKNEIKRVAGWQILAATLEPDKNSIFNPV